MSSTGKFVWYDVMTTDTKAAGSFYRKVIGWDVKDAGMSDSEYSILSIGDSMVGGLMPIPNEARDMGARPCWSGYIGVDDVDAYAKKVTAAGGKIQRPPCDIPNIGRFAVVADPHGAVFILFKGNGGEEPRPAAPGTPGHIGWHELHAGDGAAAFAFYSSLFGWTKGDAMDMGPMGVYQIFATGGDPVGGMMTKTPQTPHPFWLYYFNVDAIDAAAARVREAGGQIVNGPMEVPGNMWVVQCLDPQGAMFAMLAPKR
jgi:predicted enzyme related to lactoylglutathione lyase